MALNSFKFYLVFFVFFKQSVYTPLENFPSSFVSVFLKQSVLSTLMSGKVDGIIAVPVGRDSSLYEEINADYVPVVLVDRYFPESKLPYVTTNNYAGGYAAAEYPH